MALLINNYYTNEITLRMIIRWRHTCLLFVFFLSFSSLAANAATPEWQHNWQCGKEIAIKRSTIQYMIKHQQLNAFRLNGKALPILMSEDYAGTGLILYTRLNGRWRAYPIARASISMGVYSTAAHFRIAIFGMSRYHQMTMLNIKNQLRHLSCNVLPLPKEIKNEDTQFLTVQDFNVLPSGAGQLLGAAYDFDKPGASQMRWFRYHTNDWGYSWEQPGPIRAPHKAYKLPGSFYRAQVMRAPDWLANSLLRQAR